MPDGGEPEVSDNILARVLFYTRNLGVPARRNVGDPQVLAGKTLFHRAGCHGCHVPHSPPPPMPRSPSWQSGDPPYTDLLLHDMGEGLADHRPSSRPAAASGAPHRWASA